jgi:hypothetical protein
VNRTANPLAPNVVAIVLAVVFALRLLASVAPGGFAWGLDFARFAPPLLAWPLLVSGAGMVLFAIAGRWPAHAGPGPAGRVAGPAAGRRGGPRAWPWILAASLLALLVLLPDRVRFVGDFVLRLGILEEDWFRKLFPQTLPLDILVNHVIPGRTAGALSTEPLAIMRALGLLEAGLLVALAVRFARLVTDRTAAAVAVAMALALGGYATLLTGYSKPTPQLALCTLAAGTLGVELVRTGRAALPFAVAVAIGLALHRGGLPLLAVWAAAAALAWRRAGAERRRLWPLIVPVLVFAWEAPRLLHVIRTFDVGVNFLPPEVRHQGGALAAAFAPLRLLDAANALLLHSPLAPLAAVAFVRARRSAEALFLSAFVLAFVPVLLFVYLPLGPFRDYDSLGPAGAALAVASAWALARGLAHAARARELALGAAASVAVPFLVLLVSLTDLDRGFARAEALIQGPPRRHATQRASVLDWMGLRALNEDRYALARASYRRLCEETPLPRAFKLWGAAALIADSPIEAGEAFRRLLERVPEDPVGWYGLWMSAAATGDRETATRASERALRWGSGSREMREVVEFFESYPRLYGVMRGILGAGAGADSTARP